MEPITIDLKSLPGIVALTLALVHWLKPRLARVAYLRELPVAAYVAVVSGGVTWLASAMGFLEGDRVSLITQAILQALAASGAVEWWRAGANPVADTTAARRDRDRRHYTSVLLPVLLAIGLATPACASAGKILVESDRGIHATLSAVDDFVNRACDLKLRSEADCKAFNAVVADGWGAYRRFNEAAQAGSVAGVPAMVTALADIRAAALKLEPQGHALLDDLRRWHDTLKQLLAKEGKADA